LRRIEPRREDEQRHVEIDLDPTDEDSASIWKKRTRVGERILD